MLWAYVGSGGRETGSPGWRESSDSCCAEMHYVWAEIRVSANNKGADVQPPEVVMLVAERPKSMIVEMEQAQQKWHS